MEDYDRGFNTWREAFEFALFAAILTKQKQRVHQAANRLEWLVEPVRNPS